MSRENVELVRKAYAEGYARRDVSALRDRADPDFRFHMRTSWPSRRVYRFEELPQVWADLDDTYEEYVLAPGEFEDVDDYVVVTLHQSSRVKGSDARVESTIWHVWHITQGVAREAWTFDQRAEALAAVGRAE